MNAHKRQIRRRKKKADERHDAECLLKNLTYPRNAYGSSDLWKITTWHRLRLSTLIIVVVLVQRGSCSFLPNSFYIHVQRKEKGRRRYLSRYSASTLTLMCMSLWNAQKAQLVASSFTKKFLFSFFE
jgi:hypothetical protein